MVSTSLNAMHFNDVSHFGAVGALGIRCVVLGGVSVGLTVISKNHLEEPFLRLKRYFEFGK